MDDLGTRLCLAALDVWEGTPEELGETLEVASQPIEPKPWPGSTREGFVEQNNAAIRAARARLNATPEGRALLRHEMLTR